MLSNSNPDATRHAPPAHPRRAAADDPRGADEAPTLEETARREREYVRERLRGEWGRDPSEEELDEWLRDHTEGH